MKINFKYDVGDLVWYISGNKVNKGHIVDVIAKIGEFGIAEVEYILCGEIKLLEHKLFSSKVELLKSL